ncbi:MAG: O-antigen ligase family protein [Caldilineaceae bacterium]
MLTHNWQLATKDDFTLLPALTAWIQARQPVWGEGIALHENLFAGVLIGLLPVAVVTLWQMWHQQHPAKYWSLIGTIVGAFALLLTFSRGAWLGLLGGSLLAAYLHWRTNQRLNTQRKQAYQRQVIRRRQQQAHRRQSALMAKPLALLDRILSDWSFCDWLIGLGLFGVIVTVVGVTFSPTFHAWLLQPIAGTYLEMTINSRLAVWLDTVPLIQDYLYTGSGLGSTPMVLATYVYLLHVPYLNHAHSLYLQIMVEQGLPGLIGFVGMIIGSCSLGLLWLRQGSSVDRLYAAGALAAQFALLIYGGTDAELYAGAFVPLLFLPSALLIGCAAVGSTAAEHELSMVKEPGPLALEQGRAERNAAAVTARWIGGLLPLFALILFLTLPGTANRWLLNRTAVAQTRQELQPYEWPAWPLQDAVRRSELVDTATLLAGYEHVLEQAPHNASAQRRLGQLALSLGDYQMAAEHLAAAYELAPQSRATRQLLGEVKALLGDEAEAVTLWRSVDVSEGQLELRRWWYEEVGKPLDAERIANAVAAAQMQK